MPNRRHFHTFDAMRFFACFKVFLLHLPLTAFPLFNFIRSGGGIGVQFFFVLSGFLITYIILNDKKHHQFNLKKFFAKRILRIWPLFYLMILFAYTVNSTLEHFAIQTTDEGYNPNWLMSILFLENYQMMIKNDFPNGSPLRVMWSLCIEEHFYIIWGLSFYLFSSKNIHRFLYLGIFIGTITRLIYYLNAIPSLDIFSHIDLFSYGGLISYYLINNEKEMMNFLEKINFKKQILFLVFSLLLILYLSNYSTHYAEIYSPTILGLCFAVLIMFTLHPKTRFKINDNHILSQLGLYTYSFYLFHTIIISALFLLFKTNEIHLDKWVNASIFGVLSFSITLFCSFISYHLFEKQFLKLKKLF